MRKQPHIKIINHRVGDSVGNALSSALTNIKARATALPDRLPNTNQVPELKRILRGMSVEIEQASRLLLEFS